MKHDGLLSRAMRLVRSTIQVSAFEPWARALEDHYRTGRPTIFYVHDSSGLCMTHSTAEGFSVTAPFKVIQEKALQLCRGRVLDLGAGVGRDALVLKQSGLDVLAVDIEPRCVDIMKDRGLTTAVCANVYNLDDSHFDTIIVMQMTIGLAGSLEGMVQLLARLGQLMSPDGQILLDSMAPAYHVTSPHYPGERQIQLYYGRYVGAATSWLYIDYDVLRTCAKQVSMDAELISNGSSSLDYLARLFKVRNERLAK